MANNFSAPKSRSLPTPTNVQDLSSTLTAWKSQLAPLVKNAAPVSTPVNFRVTSARGGLQLSWSPVAGADGYEILKSMDGSFTDDLVVIPISGANNSSYFDSLGGSSQSSNYRVRTTSGTSNNPQSQRGPESGVVSHTSLDSADTKSATTTVLDNYTSDKTRAGARLGNYGAIQTSDAGSVASGTSGSLVNTASSTTSPSTSAGAGVSFDKIAGGSNIAATMTVAQNASIVPDVNIPGVISATNVQTIPATTALPNDKDGLRYNVTSGDLEYSPTPETIGPTLHEFVTSYDETTGAFASAQPADSDLAVSDNTANNVSITAHGFAPKGDGTTTKFLNANGSYSSGIGPQAALAVTGATPTGSGTDVSLGITVGFGNGAPGAAVTTTALGTGSGPSAPNTVVNYLQIDIGGAKFWVPLVQ